MWNLKLEYAKDSHFDRMCEKLKQFVELHGHCIVPLEEGQGEAESLGPWAQRMRIRMAAGALTEERAARLRELGLPLNNKEARHDMEC